MAALLHFPATSFNLSSFPTKPSFPFTKPAFLPASFKCPKFNSFSIRRNRSEGKIFAIATQPSSQTATEEPSATEPELHEENKKFDWYAHWYPLAPVCDLDKSKPHAKTVLGLEVVVWWDREEEKWRVFEDRCPHRMAPLSEGRIDPSGRLQCVYHGWCFDGKGSCKFIPQAPSKGPPIETFKKACTVVYPCCEQNKIVWFWPNSDPQYKDIALKKMPPYIPELDDPSFTNNFGIREMPYGYEALVENLMDPAHVPYAHYGVLNTASGATSNKRDREGGMPLENKVETMNIDGYFATQVFGYCKFIAPSVYYSFPKGAPSDDWSSPIVEQEKSGNSVEKQRMALIVFFCIPVGPGRSRLIWIFPRNFSSWYERFLPRWVDHLQDNLVIDGDLYLIHAAEKRVAKFGASNWQKTCFIPTKADALVVGFRKWLKKYSDNKIDWSSKYDSEQLLSSPREKLMDRYWSHVVHCTTCQDAEKLAKALELTLQVISVATIGILAALGKDSTSMVGKIAVVSVAMMCFLASRWLSDFISKTFHYHDYFHAHR